MSDIQELIHKTSMDCIEKGKRDEQERIIKLLEKLISNHRETNVGTIGHCACPVYEYIIAVIKGHENV